MELSLLLFFVAFFLTTLRFASMYLACSNYVYSLTLSTYCDQTLKLETLIMNSGRRVKIYCRF